MINDDQNDPKLNYQRGNFGGLATSEKEHERKFIIFFSSPCVTDDLAI